MYLDIWLYGDVLTDLTPAPCLVYRDLPRYWVRLRLAAGIDESCDEVTTRDILASEVMVNVVVLCGGEGVRATLPGKKVLASLKLLFGKLARYAK